MIGESINIGPEPAELHSRCAGENGHSGVGGNELALPERCQFADRHAVACDDERLSAIERAHDLSARVAKFPLGDLASHGRIVARVLRHAG